MKHIKTLQSKKGRKEHGEFLAEGVRLLEEAYRCKAKPNVLYVAESQLSDRAAVLVQQFRQRGVRIESVSARQMSGLSETRSPQGLLGVFATPTVDPAQLSPRSYRRVLLCEGIGDPGNLGTLLRSALAFGFGLVVLIDGCAEAHAPKVVRSSAGAVFGLTVWNAARSEALGWFKKAGIAMVAADGRGKETKDAFRAAAGESGLALALGSEAVGLSPEIIQASRLVYRIGHESGVESLNVAVAGSILMKQVYDFS